MIVEQVGRYKIERKIGQGGMAAVYLAEDPRFGRKVAVKLLPSTFLHDPKFRGRFDREARAIAQLEHPSIVPVYDVGDEDGQPYLVMRYMAGGTLSRKILDKRVFTVQEALPIIQRIANALDVAHTQGIIHRDLKPANILFDNYGNPYLSDFGIAHLIEATSAYTGSAILGTPKYMSPEHGQGKRVDGRSDIYSLGIILFQMLTGRVPYQSDSAIGVMMQHINEPPPHVTETNPQQPAAIDPVVIKAMAKEPDDRYQTAAAFAQAVDDVANGKISLPTPIPPPIEAPKTEILTEAAVPLAETTDETETMFSKPDRRVPVVPLAIGGIAIVLLTLVALLIPRLFDDKDDLAVTAELTSVAQIALATDEAEAGTPTAEVKTQLVASEPTQTVVVQQPPPINRDNVTALAEVGRLGKGLIREVAYSPDGQLIAVASSTGVHLYDTETLTQTAYFDTEQYQISLAFSPDGTTVASGSFQGVIKMWSVDDGTLLHDIEGHSNWVRDLAYSPDGTMLASGSYDNSVQLWNAYEGTLIHKFDQYDSSVTSVAYTPDGNTLATGERDGEITIINLTNRTIIRTIPAHNGVVYTLAYSPDGRTLASGSFDDTVKLWGVFDSNLIRSLEAHQNDVINVVFSPDGTQLASAGDDQQIIIWNTADGTELSRFSDHDDAVQTVAYSPDGIEIASGGFDGVLHLRETAAPHTIRASLTDYTNVIYDVAYDPSGLALIAGSRNELVNLWHIADETLINGFAGHSSRTRNVAYSDDGEMMVSSSYDGSLRLWRPDGELIDILKSGDGSITAMALSPDGETIITGSFDGTINAWRVDGGNGKLLYAFDGHSDFINDVQFTADGTRFVTSADDNLIKIWDIDGNLISTLDGHERAVLAVAITADGDLIASGGEDSKLLLWRTSDETVVGELIGHTDIIRTLTFNENGSLLLSGSNDKMVKVWDVDQQTLLHTTTGHTSWVRDVTYSPDGATIATGSMDGTIRLWKIIP